MCDAAFTTIVAVSYCFEHIAIHIWLIIIPLLDIIYTPLTRGAGKRRMAEKVKEAMSL